jgi:hypothetical protein
MAEAEFVSELLIAMSIGIRERSKTLIDNFYRDNDDRFPNGKKFEIYFRETFDIIGAIFGDSLIETKFREARLLYPLFCAIYHLNHGLPNFTKKRIPIKLADYPKLLIALSNIQLLFEKINEASGLRERINSGESIEDIFEEEKKNRIDEGELEDDVENDLQQTLKKIDAGQFEPLTQEEEAFYDAYSVHWVHADRRMIMTEHIYNYLYQALEESNIK